MSTRASILVAAFVQISIANASVTLTVDRLDSSDGGAQPPPAVIVVDVLVEDVAATDRWTLAGFRGETFNGARLLYALDPTGEPLATNPGTANRFVSFVSDPHDRDADDRFTGSSVAVDGACNDLMLEPTQFDIAWFDGPPWILGTEGAILRVAISIDGLCGGAAGAEVFVGPPPSPEYIALLVSECPKGLGTLFASFQNPTVTGFGWGLYYLPQSTCDGDVDCDLDVDLSDLALFLQSFGSHESEPLYRNSADVVHDGQVNIMDLAILLAAFGDACE